MLGITRDEFIKLIPERDRSLFSNVDKDFNVYCSKEGNFCVVLMEACQRTLKYVGVAKRNPCDKDCSDTGMRIAAIRALKLFVGKDPGYSRQRPVSKKGARVASRVAYMDKVFDKLANDDYSD